MTDLDKLKLYHYRASQALREAAQAINDGDYKLASNCLFSATNHCVEAGMNAVRLITAERDELANKLKFALDNRR